MSMKTIVFYSQLESLKRTEKLEQCARRLIADDKKVVLLDANIFTQGIGQWMCCDLMKNKGLIDYLLFYQDFGEASVEIQNYLVASGIGVNYPFIIPAMGNVTIQQYLTQVLSIDWRKMFPETGLSTGVALLMYLKDLIEARLNPDYLLIEVPAGITDIGNAIIKRLADLIICMSTGASNEMFTELYGDKKFVVIEEYTRTYEIMKYFESS